MKDAIRIKGLVSVTLQDEFGNVKSQSFHNTLTNQGLGLIADLMANTPAKQKLDTSHTYIVIGTGYSATLPAQQTWVHTQTGSPAPMQSGYPTSGTYPNPTVTYSATFSAGSLNASNINEACLVNSPISGSGQSLAYAQISPAVTVASTDSLTVSWTITFTAG